MQRANQLRYEPVPLFYQIHTFTSNFSGVKIIRMINLIRRVLAFFFDLIETVVMALAVFVIFYLFLFQPHQVKGSSMFPTFHDGEYILTDKFTYRLREPKRGEVIIFRAPGHEEYDYIKRIIGMPGDTIKIENNKVVINNQVLDEAYLPSDYYTSAGNFLRSGQSVTVPEDQFFALGDNRAHSSDSREWGFVPRQNLVGRAWFRYWPPKRVGLIKENKYAIDS